MREPDPLTAFRAHLYTAAMNGSKLQLAATIIALSALAVCTIAAVVGTEFFSGPTELTYTLVGGLTSASSVVVGYIFGSKSPPPGGL